MDASGEIVYLNGRFVPRCEARLDIEDRGALFADGVYEVIRYFAGRPFAMEAHLTRLQRSLDGLRLAMPEPAAVLARLSNDLVARNGLRDAKLYWQVTRGSGPRDHAFPARDVPPTVFAIAYPLAGLPAEPQPRELAAITLPDERWSNSWIKSVSLLPNILAKQRAIDAGCDEAILHREGRVTEGTSTNVMIVTGDTIRTHPANQWILPGVTRAVVLELARKLGYHVEEHAFACAALREADEVLICSTTLNVASAVRIDSQAVGDATAGPVARRLLAAMHAHIAKSCQLDTQTTSCR